MLPCIADNALIDRPFVTIYNMFVLIYYFGNSTSSNISSYKNEDIFLIFHIRHFKNTCIFLKF